MPHGWLGGVGARGVIAVRLDNAFRAIFLCSHDRRLGAWWEVGPHRRLPWEYQNW